MDSADLMPSSFSSSTNALEANCSPRSEMILSGSPNLLYKFSSKSFPVSLAVMVLLHGMMITPLLRPWSTTTKIELKLLIDGRSVINSIEQ